MDKISAKLDKLLVDVAVVKVAVEQHTKEMSDLKTQLEPIFFQATGFRWAMRIGGMLIAVITCLTGILKLMK